MRDFTKTKRIVIKVGTNVLSKNGRVDTVFLSVIARQIAALVRQQRQVILVTSGAIGMGVGSLGIQKKITEVKMRQACAAVGQGILMHEYQKAFGRYRQKVAQVLITNDIMSTRKYYVNLKNAVETLLAMGVVPIINENDSVSVAEIDLAFGDNDRLSALVAAKIDAELLIILTDVKGLYSADPRRDRQARLVPVVYEITDDIEQSAGQAGSRLAVGGMATKIAAVRIAANGGCKAILAHGRDKDVILRIMEGREIGTLFMPRRRLSSRKQWILNSLPRGVIEVDDGAACAIRDNRSLLPVGVTSVKGHFGTGDVVEISGIAKGISKISAEELRTLIRDKQTEKTKKRKAIIHVNDLVLY
ncbi:MAG: glutamate 5-kinase [Sedimentisphaerales bacterium]|nr:glutamate 5-kinase [Sedimentisphaerales bacterium]